MKILYFGGQKSGKSTLAEQKALELCKNPIYIATYDNSFDDKEMALKIDRHKNQRSSKFQTIEEPLDLIKVIKDSNTYLIDCISMWILNNIEEDEENLLKQIEIISKTKSDIIYVLNDVNSGVIPIDKLSRKFIDLTGIIGQKIASLSDEVYEVKLGIGVKIK